jgi:hypothetical protein
MLPPIAIATAPTKMKTMVARPMRRPDGCDPDASR